MRKILEVFFVIIFILIFCAPVFSLDTESSKENSWRERFFILTSVGTSALDSGTTNSLTEAINIGDVNALTGLGEHFLNAPRGGFAFYKGRESQWSHLNTTLPYGRFIPYSDDIRFNLEMLYRTAVWESGIGLAVQQSAVSGPDYFANPNCLAFIPYVRGSFGPLKVDGQLIHHFGSSVAYSPLASINNKVIGFGAYGRIVYATEPAYWGASIALSQGVDGTLFKERMKPALIFESNINQSGRLLGQVDPSQSFGNTCNNTTNFWLYQSFIGLKTNPRLDLNLTFSIAKLDQRLAGSLSDDLGSELDFTATYRIFDNLNFMTAFGYLWAGEALKGTFSGTSTSNDWLLMHRLTLNF